MTNEVNTGSKPHVVAREMIGRHLYWTCLGCGWIDVGSPDEKPNGCPNAEPEAQHREVIVDALVSLYERAPVRRDEIQAALRAMGEWHDHDPEDECCHQGCSAWFPGAYCAADGEQHPAPTEDAG